MGFITGSRYTASSILFAVVAWASSAAGIGETVNGFPNYQERLLHQDTNDARMDPQRALENCTQCGERDCYEPVPPVYYKRELNRAARFHSDEMVRQGFFSHPSICTVVENIDALYPDQCDGSASCACVGGQSSCNPTCTSWQARVKLFGTDTKNGEIIASGGSAFHLWLFESSPDPTCEFTYVNGHRWVLLTSGPAIGFGVSGMATGEFGSGGEVNKIASGIHTGLDFRATWHDTHGPSSALVNVDGTCHPMTLSIGVETNGTYKADLSSLGSDCHRYFFLFRDAADVVVTYPTTGSLGTGTGDACPTWSEERPSTGASCDCAPQCAGAQCGDDTCGGSCGTCEPGKVCEGKTCVAAPAGTGGSGTGGSSSGTGGASVGGSSTGPVGGSSNPEGNGYWDADESSGCACRTKPSPGSGEAWFAVLLFVALTAWVRNPRRTSFLGTKTGQSTPPPDLRKPRSLQPPSPKAYPSPSDIPPATPPPRAGAGIPPQSP